MARIVTLRPSGTVTGNTSNIWKTEGGSTFDSSHLGKLGDENQATRASRLSGGGSADLDFEFDTYTKTADERFRRVRIRVREGHTTGPGQHWLRIGTGNVITASKLSTPSGYVGNIWSMFTGPWVNEGSSGEWSQADVDTLRAKLRGLDGQFIIPEVYLDVEVMSKPTVVVPPPVQSNGKASLTPIVNWTFGDPTDTQANFQIKVFTKAVAEAGGFDPDDLTHIWTVGVQSSYLTHTIPAGVLEYGADYYVFVKSWTSFAGVTGAADYESEWSDGTSFTTQSVPTTSVSAPADPVDDIDSPTVEWSVSDPNGDTLGAWTLKLFTAAQYGAPGFSPDTSAATYTASSTTTTLPEHQLPRLINGTTYRAYVKTVSKKLLVPAPWAYAQFEMDLLQPAAPAYLQVYPYPASASVGIEVITETNILSPEQADGEAGGPTWLADVDATCTLATDGPEHLQKLTPTDTGLVSIKSTKIPAQEFLGMAAAAEVKCVAGTDRQVSLGVSWYDADDNLLGGSQGSFVTTTGTTAVRPSVTSTALDGTAYAILKLFVDSATPSDEFTLDKAVMRYGGGVPTFTPGFGPMDHMVERSIDDGATWEPVRGYPSRDIYSFLYDHEAPFNIPVKYRANSTTEISGSPVSSDWSTVATTTLSVGVVWVKNPLDPTQNAHVYVEGSWLPSNRYKARQVHKPLGSTLPKVIRGDGDYETFNLDFICIGDDMHEALEDLLAADVVLCIQSGKRTRYVEVSGEWTSSESLWDDLRGETQEAWKVSVPFVEVAAP